MFVGSLASPNPARGGTSQTPKPMYEQKNETPVLMLTAAGTENIAVEAMKLGAYDYIKKDQLDLEHLPINLNGIYERYLFRKERENNQSASNALVMLKMEIEESENNKTLPLRLKEIRQLANSRGVIKKIS